VEEGLVDVSPMRKRMMPKLPKELLPAFSKEDVGKLLAACRTLRDTALVHCLLDSGCRASEFVVLNTGSVDMGTGAVAVRQGKGKKDRTTFLGAKSRRALRRYLRERKDVGPDELLFPSSRTGERLTTSGLVQFCKRLGDRAGVEHCHPHTFRRSCALWSLRAGMDLVSLSRILGHESLDILRLYLKQDETDLQQAHREHSPIDRWL
jgi:site-specific recombinase XerD